MVARGGRPVAEFAFGLPGEPVPDWTPDEQDARLTIADGFSARLRHLPDEDGWTTIISLDNGADVERALPPLGMAVTVASGWAGWSWTSDTEGVLVVAPAAGEGQALQVRVGRGFVRAAQSRPVFVPRDRRGDGLGDGVAAFHLAHPTGALRGHGRHQTTLEFSAVPHPDAAASVLPSWLPPLVVANGDELRLDLPDQAIVPGPGVELATADTTSVLTGQAGHREVAIHGLGGVQRLRASFTPAQDAFVADLTTALTSRRPSGAASATGGLVAAALARRAVLDADRSLDWLEREDWLARGDVWGPAIAAVVATETHDDALLEAARAAVLEGPVGPGSAIVASRVWLATLRMGAPPLDLSAVFARLDAAGAAGLEAAVLRGAAAGPWTGAVAGLVHRLGGGLPGQPVGFGEPEAGLAIAVLRLVPEHWRGRQAATVAAEKGAGLLLADHADGLHPTHDGLAWLLLGEVSA